MKTISTGNEAPDDMVCTDPTRKYKSLEFLEYRNPSRIAGHYLGPEEELCWACGWNTRNQMYSSYGSRIRIMHTRQNSGIWTIGTRWLLRDEPNDRYLGNNYITLTPPATALDHSSPTRNPQPKPNNGSHIFYLGVSGARQYTDGTPRLQKVDVSQLDDIVLGVCSICRPGNCFKIGYTVDEWLDSLGADLRMGLSRVYKTVDPIVIEEKFQELKASFPDCEPYVLTHADFNLSNIIVKDGKIQGIVDWEQAGYYPWSMERRATYMNSNEYSDELFDPVWKELMPEIDFEKWTKLIDDKMFPAERAWGHCSHAHPGKSAVWWRPSFCECKPVQGEFKAADWGMPLSCIIAELSPEQEALLEGYKRKDPWALKHEEASDTPPHGGDESK